MYICSVSLSEIPRKFPPEKILFKNAQQKGQQFYGAAIRASNGKAWGTEWPKKNWKKKNKPSPKCKTKSQKERGSGGCYSPIV